MSTVSFWSPSKRFQTTLNSSESGAILPLVAQKLPSMENGPMDGNKSLPRHSFLTLKSSFEMHCVPPIIVAKITREVEVKPVSRQSGKQGHHRLKVRATEAFCPDLMTKPSK